MLQQDIPGDYVVGTGVGHSVREFLLEAFRYLGIELEWTGNGIKEKAKVGEISGAFRGTLKTGLTLVEIDPKYFRPTEVDNLAADIRKAKKELGWVPRVQFSDLVKVMVDYDMLRAGLKPPGEGINILLNKEFGWTNHAITQQDQIKEGLE